MTVEQLRMHYRARPFRPFDIHLGDGRCLSVPHPEFLALSPTGRTVVVSLPDGTFEIVDLLLVTSLEVRASGPRRAKSSP